MPHRLRLDAPGAPHHVMVRGLERRAIFRDDRDRADILDRLARLVAAGAMTVYAWAVLPVLVSSDPRHSTGEVRYFALGRTDHSRKLTIVFTLRGSRLRMISARPVSRRERRVYGQGQGA